ncbi:hypothetical protein KQ51_00743 [Candidatus Izimaplasma bacterium HR1]|jgi:hypothetical protein|uniref:hypothetical protein n=1 Tax=Candidatus Izimoplasma sp. HR1 TaxID=1541959 RepID=UPI0004F5C046|nr:hypothetical protein KQ51_00743 [Candidatus Izimaplasma bacterium HR1]
MVSKELSKYIESLRKRRNISIDDFTFDIVSVRQYKRYLSGTSEMPYRTFISFSKKLGFNPTKIQGDLEESKVTENEKIENFYNSVIRHEYEKAEEYMKEVDEDFFLLPELEVYFRATVVLLHYLRDDKPKKDCRIEIYRIIDFPRILEKDLFHQSELLVLALLLMFIDGEDKIKLMDKLSKQLLKDKITIGTEFYARQYVTLRLAREYGVSKQDDKVIELCLNAIDLSKRPKIHFNFDFFYYYLALSYRNLKDSTNKKNYYKKLYYYLKFLDEPSKTRLYEKKFKKDFGIEFTEVETKK